MLGAFAAIFAASAVFMTSARDANAQEILSRITSYNVCYTKLLRIEEELLPGLDLESDEALMGYVRQTAWTVFHVCGTCSMGSDPATSVVDPRLRVHGVQGLRVADASIFLV